MCTTGWYPLAVAPVITTGFLLSLYSSVGCEFIDLQVGFTPNNLAWNTSQADLGLFYYRDASAVAKTAAADVFHNGCVWYKNNFQDLIINKDRTWKVSRVMAMISVSASLVAALTVWLIVFVPVPIGCIWSGLLLPTTMLSLICEASKFLFFDVALCHNAVWYPSGINSLPEKADSCTMGLSAYMGIAAAAIHLISLICVCLKAPKKRQIHSNFGVPSGENACEEFVDETAEQDYRNTYEYDGEYAEEDPSILDEDLYTEGPSPSSNSLLLKETIEDEDITSQDDSSDPHEEAQQEESPAINDYSQHERISSSRMAALSKMELTNDFQSQDMIEKLVTDLDTSLATGGHNEWSKFD